MTIPSHPDLKVITRQGYFDSRAPARLTADNMAGRRLQTELAAAETSTMVYDGIPLALRPMDTPGRYQLHLEGQGLYWTPATPTEPRTTKLILLMTTFDKKGKVLKTEAKSLTIKATGEVPPTGRLERAINLDYQIPTDPKAVRARFVVRVDASGRMGTADVDLTGAGAATASTAKP